MQRTAEDVEFHLDPGGALPSFPDLFGRTAPVAIEVGTGNGLFLTHEAAQRPEVNFLGIERAGEFFGKCVRRVTREGLSNVRCICAEAEDVFELFDPGTIAGVYCLFSDPWPKRRHRRRRLFAEPFLGLLERALAPGGWLVFKTDVGWYFNLSIHELRTRPGWTIEEVGPKPEPDPAKGEVLTNFERKAREAGSSVWGFRATWDGTDS